MKNRISLLLGLSVLLLASTVHAQAPQTWVSGVGDDFNPCSRTAPCRTFAHTISVTAVGGEISVLDPGDFRAFPPVSLVDFGPLTIAKSITINGNSIAVIIPSDGETGVTVNVATAGDPGVVILRGLSINGARNYAIPGPPEMGGLNGIKYQAGGKLVIDHCNIYGFTQNGIDVSAASGNLVVSNTTVTSSATGIHLDNTTLAQVTNSLITGNSAFGVNAEQGTISVANVLLSNNGVAVRAVAPARVRLSNNEIFDNATGMLGCGRIASAGNNKRAGSPGCNPGGAPITVQ